MCFDDDETEEFGVITEHAIITRMKALDWPSAQLVVEPPNGRTLVNLPTNFYTELVDPWSQSVQMLGYHVEVRATPESYTWHFGDGSPAETGNDPGASYAVDDSLRVSHVYTEAKVTVHPSVDVTYSGAFRVDGGPWRTIPTTLTVSGATVSLRRADGDAAPGWLSFTSRAACISIAMSFGRRRWVSSRPSTNSANRRRRPAAPAARRRSLR